jgi:hypothetical protein
VSGGAITAPGLKARGKNTRAESAGAAHCAEGVTHGKTSAFLDANAQS